MFPYILYDVAMPTIGSTSAGGKGLKQIGLIELQVDSYLWSTLKIRWGYMALPFCCLWVALVYLNMLLICCRHDCMSFDSYRYIVQKQVIWLARRFSYHIIAFSYQLGIGRCTQKAEPVGLVFPYPRNLETTNMAGQLL